MRKLISLLLATGLLVGCTATTEEAEDTAPTQSSQEMQVESDAENEVVEPPVVGIQFNDLWPEGFKRIDSIATARAQSMAFFDQTSSGECSNPRTVFVEHDVDYSVQMDLVIDTFMSLACHYFEKEVFIAIGGYAFAKEQLAETDAFLDDFGGVCGKSQPGGSTGCALNNTVWVQQRPTSDALEVTGILAHELFHVIQDSTQTDVAPTWRTPPDGYLFVPSWFIEGGANFFQGMLLEYLGISDYEHVLEGPPTLLMGRNLPPSLANLEQGWTPSVYQKGQFGAEYLVANAGFSVLLEPFVMRNRGVPYNDALFELLGLSKSDFYALVDTVDFDTEG